MVTLQNDSDVMLHASIALNNIYEAYDVMD